MQTENWRREVFDWGEAFLLYLRKKLKTVVFHFETAKGEVVSFLMVKRGRYSRPFLNLSLFLLIGVGILAGPIIAETYPTIAKEELGQFASPSTLLTSLTPQEFETKTVISQKPRDKVMIYKVQTGDTLSLIAQKFGISVDTIRWANNNLSEKAKLKIDQELKIPPVTGIVVKVSRGETIYSLAKKYQTDAQNIVNFPFNDFDDLDTFALNIGQILIVPDGVPPKEKPIIIQTPLAPLLAGGTGQFAWPTGGRVTQRPVWYHMAVDIANKEAPGIAAAESGVVSYVAQQTYAYGYHVIIDHGNGLQTLYAHLSQIYVASGESVGRGQIVGKMGSTGRSTGTHLHFEVRKNGVAVNPLPYLK
ncbi:peptidoglycan DD-metalloendopeptidase family protein [Candidatus Microgenomates bacterium]|nr:peptidoglycan DD-metalloendopeptidase family protein [Candidatus Microgenomates bacterium]